MASIVNINAPAVLLVILKLPFIGSPVAVPEDSEPMPLALNKLSRVPIAPLIVDAVGLLRGLLKPIVGTVTGL